KEEVRLLQAQIALQKQANQELRRQIAELHHPKGIEKEARKMGMVRPGEELLQTSDTPPPQPPTAGEPHGETNGRPALSAVSYADRPSASAWDLASRSLARWMWWRRGGPAGRR
ncbi:MAG: septum formation initiator family protein, partial [Armatimonadota bacterium]|nr:septum formation initiator family protein [Armatimonadota bacterium]